MYYKITADLDFSKREQWSSKPFDYSTAHFVCCLVTLTDSSSIPMYTSSAKTDITAYSNSTDMDEDSLNNFISSLNESISSFNDGVANLTYSTNAHCEWTFVESNGELAIVRTGK